MKRLTDSEVRDKCGRMLAEDNDSATLMSFISIGHYLKKSKLTHTDFVEIFNKGLLASKQ